MENKFGVGEMLILNSHIVRELYEFAFDDVAVRDFYSLSVRHDVPVEALILRVKADGEGDPVYLVELSNAYGIDELWLNAGDLMSEVIGEA